MSVREAAEKLLERYVQIIKDSGECRWDPETDDEVVALRASLAAPCPAGEVWGWAILGRGQTNQHNDIPSSPLRNAYPEAKSRAESLAKEIDGTLIPLYAAAPPAQEARGEMAKWAAVAIRTVKDMGLEHSTECHARGGGCCTCLMRALANAVEMYELARLDAQRGGTVVVDATERTGPEEKTKGAQT